MKKIVILAHAPQKTLGDPSAAAKLQQFLIEEFNKHHKEFAIKVIINVPQTDEEPVRNLFQGEMQYELVNQFDSPTGQIQLQQAISDSDLIIIYPTPHFITPNIARLIADSMKPVLSIGEYDYDIQYHHSARKSRVEVVPGSIFLSSGVGEGNLGIYIEKSGGRSHIHPTDFSKLPNDLMAKDKQLYFGYFNKLFNSQTGATPARFIAFAILNSHKKEVDIVLPLQSPEITKISSESKGNILESASFIKELEDFNQVQIAYIRQGSYPVIYLLYQKKDNKLVLQEISEEEFEAQQRKSDKIIRIINPFPLHKNSVQALVEASEPINLLTGDQSFSEALSLSKVIFYQAMSWKKNFYNALIAASEKYKILQEWFQMVDKPSTPVQSLVTFYEKNKEALIAETHALKKDFEINKNLAVIVLDYLNNFLNSNPYERFTQLFEHMRQHPQLYADEKKSETGDVYILSKVAVIKHLNFYLKNATTVAEKNEIFRYFNSHVNSLIKLNELDKIWLYLDLKAQHPDLDISLTASSLIECFANLSRLYLEIYDSYGSPIFQTPSIPNPTNSKPDNEQEEESGKEEGEEEEPLRETMMSLRTLLKPLTLVNIAEFSPSEKLQILKEITHSKAVCYSKNMPDELFLKFFENETDPHVLRQALKLLFTTPCYIDQDEGAKFDPEEPSLFFQITKYRAKLVEMLLNNPVAIDLLFEELFREDAPPVQASNNAKMNELVLEALLFSAPTRSTAHPFFSSSPHNVTGSREKELICKILSAGEKDPATVIGFLQEKFATDPEKMELFKENFGELLPRYVKEGINEPLIAPTYQ